MSHDARDVAGSGAELGIVVAYGRIIAPDLLAAVPMVNIHFSLLPRWRGAAPVERAILAGDDETGVCIMKVEEGLDTGGIFASWSTSIGDESAEELRWRLARAGTELLVDALASGTDLMGEGHRQGGEPTQARKISMEELRIDWTRPATDVCRTVRVGRAWTTWRERRLVIWEARPAPAGAEPEPHSDDEAPPRPGTIVGAKVATGEGFVELIEVQQEGKRRMPARQWILGASMAPGDALGGS